MIELGSFVSPVELHGANIGDVIEVDNILYSRWGIYTGEHEVVVLCREGEGVSETEAVVKICSLSAVCEGCGVRINNKEVPAMKRGLSPLSREQIMKSVRASIGKKLPYNLLSKNSEYYVTLWKYGRGWSDQAEIALRELSPPNSPQKDLADLHHYMLTGLQSILKAV